MTDQPCPKCGYPGRFCRCGGNAGGERSREARLESALREMLDATISRADGRDLLEEMHPETWHYVSIIVRRDQCDKNYEGDWLKMLWYARQRALAALHQEGEA